MFNTYYSKDTEYKPYVKTVIENRAATDESIKFYDEIKEKAYDSILCTIPIQNNSFNGNLMIYKDICQFNKICKYIFYLNGKEFKGSFDIDDNFSLDREKLIFNFYKILSEEIAKQLFQPETFLNI
jgi:hypothetical protein